MGIRKDLTTDTLNILQRMFGVKVNKNAKSKADVVTPRDTSLKSDGTIDYISQDTFPPQVQRLYDFWVTTYFDKEKYNSRIELWTEMENLYFNDPIIARAVNIKTDETIQADINMQPIFVEGDKAQVDFLLEFYDNVGLYPKLRPTIFDLNLFGNHAWILGINGDQGIDEIIQPDVYSLTERLEFFPAELEAELLKASTYSSFFSQDRVSELINAITNKDNITSVHKRYLLGFVINNYILPPWRVLHFRNFTTRSPFSPFGVPGQIHSLAPYKQYDAAMTFQVMARAANFPIDKYSLNLPNIIDDAEKFSVLLSFIEKLDNIGIRQAKKDDKNLGDRIFTIRDLFDFEQISSDIDIGKIADIDMLKDERIISSGLPRNIIDPNDSGFGDSGIAIIQKWKELARSVFHTQGVVLEQITQLSKLQMILTGKFAVNDFNFILSMPFPESQTNGDLISNQKDLMDLFVTLADTLSDKFLGGEPLPQELLNDLLQQVMPYDQARIDSWIDQITKAKKEIDASAEEEGGGEDDFGSDMDFGDEEDISDNEDMSVEEPVESDIDIDDLNFESTKKINSYKKRRFIEHKRAKQFKENIKRKTKMSYKEAVEHEFMNIRQRKMREGIFGGRHYYSSKNYNPDFRAETLVKIDKRLLESFDSVDYKFDDSVFDINKKESKKRGKNGK